jgi:hypothetical protein
MTDRRMRDLRRLLEATAEPYGATIRIEHSGRHLRCTFTIGARQGYIVTSFTPSDWRFHRKVERDARRMLHSLTGAS